MIPKDKIIDGKKIANKISLNLKQKFINLNKEIKFCIFQIGENKASNKYIKYKIKKAKELGIKTSVLRVNGEVEQKNLEHFIEHQISKFNFAIIQLPLPKNINKKELFNKIPVYKDVDGLVEGNKKVVPATARGIFSLLQELKINFSKVNISVVGRSDLVGKPIAKLCKEAGAIVNTYDITTGIKGTEESDILIVAAGCKNLIKKENVKQNAILIDVGINEIITSNGKKKIVGDVERNKEIINKVSKITPVPGGVGPMTVISLYENIYDLIK